MSDDLPDWRDVYAERNAQASTCWSEELREEQRQRWRRAVAARAAEQRRRRGRPRRQTNNPIAKALGYRVREVMQGNEDQASE